MEDAWLSTIPRARQEELLARHDAFWRRRPSSEALIGYAPESRVFPLQNLRIRHEGAFRAEHITEDVIQADTEYRPQADPEDDLLPAKMPLEPLAWAEGYCGANVAVSSEAQTVWTKPGEDVPESLRELDEGVQPEVLEKLKRATQENVRSAGAEYLISEPLFRGPGDCLESLIGATSLCLRLYDEPEKIAEMLQWLADRIIELARAQLSVLPQFHGGTINRYRIWGPGENIVTQCDMANLISAEHLRDVFIPAYRKLAAAFDTSTMHFHTCAHQHTDVLLAVEELAAIEWGLDPTGPTLEEMVPVFARILESKCVILMNIRTDEETKMLLNRLPHEGLCIIRRKKY